MKKLLPILILLLALGLENAFAQFPPRPLRMEEEDTEVGYARTLDVQEGLDLSESPSYEINMSLDINELTELTTSASGDFYLIYDTSASAHKKIDHDNMPGGGGGAPTDADYLVGTANASLSAEIAVGTSPGGELGGTWASPTVDSGIHDDEYEVQLDNEAGLYAVLSDVSDFVQPAELVGADETYGSGWNADTGLPEKDDIYDYLHQIDTDDDGSVDTVDDLFIKLGGDIASAGTYNFGSASVIVEIPNSTADTALGNAGEINLNAADDQLSFHGGATGEAQGEVAISLLRHITLTLDPAAWYDQESNYRVVPVMYVGDDCPEGFTITEWKVNYVGGDPTTELDMDLMFDTTPDFNPVADATVMDVMDTTAGASSADTGFDSATASNGSRMYLRFGADPTDANVVIAVDIWGYNEED